MALHKKDEGKTYQEDTTDKFGKDELLASSPDTLHTKPYVEGKDIASNHLRRIRWLEWGTNRVPGKVHRPGLLELFETPKIMVGETSGVYYDSAGKFTNNHSVRNLAPYHLFSKEAQQYIAKVLAHSLTDQDVTALNLTPVQQERLKPTELAERLVEVRAELSPQYDLRYLTALLNCKWLYQYMMTFKREGSRARFYPDVLKKWPIAKADAAKQGRLATLVDEIVQAYERLQLWQRAGHAVNDAVHIRLNPARLLDEWDIRAGDMIDASGFVTLHAEGPPTGNLVEENNRLIFRRHPLSYFESDDPVVRDYLRRYLETNQETLRRIPTDRLHRSIRIPPSLGEVRAFWARLTREEEQIRALWLQIRQNEALIDELAFDLYTVPEAGRQHLSGSLYTFPASPAEIRFVSLLEREGDSPTHYVAFPWQGGWALRTASPLPNPILLWQWDGTNPPATHWHILPVD